MTDAMAPPLLEVCLESPAGATAASRGGAGRIELCAALDVGGLTPSEGLAMSVVEVARARAIPVFAMVRPRPGDFAYDPDYLALAIAEARTLIDRGVDGLVFGACAAGVVDNEAARRWIGAVRDHAGHAIPCTFHRAIDLLADPVTAVDVVADLGFDRILTSGGAVRAIDGIATIRAMVRRAGDRTVVMAGSGVTPATAAVLARDTGVREIHASAGRPGDPIDERIAALGFARGPRRTTDATLVRAIRTAFEDAVVTR